MSVAYHKFDQFVEDLHKGVHNFSTHTFKVMLTNTQPVVGNAVLSDITEITPGNGYSAGGAAMTISSVAQVAGLLKIVAADVVITAAGGAVGPLQFVVLYNASATTPLKPLVGWWERASAITLADGDALTVDADATTGIIQDT